MTVATRERTPQAISAGPLLLALPSANLAEYRARGGYAAFERAVERGSGDDLVALVEAAGVRGRGGAAYPTALKWRAALAHPGPRFLVCNGGEDEPGSLKDRVLMEHHAHTLLEGVLLSALALGVESAFLYVNQTFTGSLQALRRAVHEAREAGYLGPAALGAGLPLDVQIVEAPAEYVAGEETAALEVIEGRSAKPRRKPPYPTEAGLWGKPTIVNNVETLATVAAIAREGAAAFRRLGTAESPGTLLVTVSGWVERPGVYEVPFGTSLRTLVEHHGGGVRGGRRLKALSPGGASTAYLDARALDTPLDYGPLKAAGSALGCATIRVVPEGACMVEELSRFATFFADGSCHQCGPCKQGTRKIATVTEGISQGTLDSRPLELLERLGVRLKTLGICGLIDGATAAPSSTTALFRQDFEHHARYGVCPSLGTPSTPLRGRRWGLSYPAHVARWPRSFGIQHPRMAW